MPNTDSWRCSERVQGRRITLLGREIEVKDYICSADGVHYPAKQETRLQVYIVLTRHCDARCPFCIAAPTDSRAAQDPAVLERILRRLKEEDCVRGISVTGGEPFELPGLLDETVSMIFSVFGTGMEVTLDTNGSGLRHLDGIRELKHVDTVHISRHHWDDRRNEEIFGRKMPGAEELRGMIAEIPYRELFVMNCMLLKGWVETAEDAHRYMDFAISLGAGKVSFITGTAVNDFIRKRRVCYEDVLRDGDPSLLFTRGFRDHGFCHCRDGIYASPEGRIIEFYGRHGESGGGRLCRALVVTPEGEVRAGFGGEILYRA